MRGSISVFLLVLNQSALLAQGSPKKPWLCHTYNGKGDAMLAIHQPQPLEWFTDHLADFDFETAWRVKNQSGWDSIKAAVTPAGRFHNADVVDILFTIPTERDPVGKLVLIGDRGQFRPVVWILAETKIEFARSAIVDVSNIEVLVNRDRISGTGNDYFEDYFVFDDDSHVPINLRLDEAIASELKKLLPPGRAVLKGGGFVIDSLHYRQDVWRDGDPNCCPSAGKVDIQFAIKGNEAVVVSATYDPAYKRRF